MNSFGDFFLNFKKVGFFKSSNLKNILKDFEMENLRKLVFKTHQIKALNKSFNFVLITPFYVNHNLIYEVFSQLHVCEKKLHYKRKTTTYTIMKICSFSYLPWYFKSTKYE
jgi:hypothetical protein